MTTKERAMNLIEVRALARRTILAAMDAEIDRAFALALFGNEWFAIEEEVKAAEAAAGQFRKAV